MCNKYQETFTVTSPQLADGYKHPTLISNDKPGTELSAYKRPTYSAGDTCIWVPFC